MRNAILSAASAALALSLSSTALLAQTQPSVTGDAPRGEADGTNIVVQQPAPAVMVEQAAPQVIVDPAQPQVTVQQAQPEIIVNQPAPVVTVDIPQPEIIVRMPQPDVNVSQAQPQVEVIQPKPQVQVVQQEQPQVAVEQDQAQVLVQRAADAEANVQLQRAGEPRVSYNRAEPRVIVNQADGQPTLRVERMGEARQQATGNAGQLDRETTAALGNTQRFTAGDMEGLEVFSARGEPIGSVQAIVRSTVDNKAYAVIAHEGAMALGDKRVTLSVEGLRMQNDRIIVPVLTDQEIRDLPAFSSYNQEFPEIEGNTPVEITRES